MSTHRRVKKLAATGGTVATKEEAERGLDSREPLHRRTRRAYYSDQSVGPALRAGVGRENTRVRVDRAGTDSDTRVLSPHDAGRRPAPNRLEPQEVWCLCAFSALSASPC